MNKIPGVRVQRLKPSITNMKRILFALTLLALVLTALPRANGGELSVDLFYNNLSGGSWIEVGDYGYGWQPDAATSDSDWRPYADGYWAYTDYGWTWVSYEDFGWATYHYGRWARLADYGWVWFPGSDLDWGPAWVSWRTGGDYVGWAPLPPRGPGVVYEGQPIGGRVDIDFDIGPAYYNFVDVRYIGEPVLRSHIYAPSYNVTYVRQTVNVTNITVKNKIVYNYGPDYTVLSAHSSRPIQRLKIERESNVDFSAAAKSGGLTKVQGDKLVLAAPATIQKPSRQMAPPTVKTKLTKDKVKIERGWSGVGDAKAEADLKQKMKTEDLKKVPPPTSAGAGSPVAGSSASPALGGTGASATPMGTVTPPVAEKGQGKGKREEQPGGSPSAPQPMTTHPGEHKGKQGGPLTTPVPPTGTSTEGVVSTPFPGQHKGKQIKPMPPESVPPSGASSGMPQATPFTGKPKGHLERNVPPITSEPGGTSAESGQGKHKGPRLEGNPNAQEPVSPMQGGAPSEGKMGKHKPEGSNVQPPAGEPPVGAPGANRGKGKGADEGSRGEAKGKKGKKGEESPAPTP